MLLSNYKVNYKNYREKKTVTLYLLFEFFSYFFLIEQFFSSFLAYSNYSLTWISAFLLIYQVTKFVFEIPTGFVADKYGRKASGYIGAILLIMSYVLLLTDNRVLFVISFFTRGMSITFTSGSIESIAVENISAEAIERLSIIRRIIMYISTATAAILAGFIIKKINYNIVILVDIIVSLLALLTITFIDEDKISRFNNTSDNISLIESLHLLKGSKIIILLLLMDCSAAFAFIGSENLYPAFLEQLGIGADIVGLFISAQLVLAAIFGLVARKIVLNVNKAFLLYILPPIGIFIIGIVYAFELPLILIPIIFTTRYILMSVYTPIKYSLFQQNVTDRYRATFISYASQAVSFGGIIFYGFSSLLSNVFEINEVLLLATILSFIAVSGCCIKLWKMNAL